MNQDQKEYQLLVVDDEDTQRNALYGYLSKLGYPVFEARDGAQALSILEKFTVDLVLTDFRMPNLDGQQLLSRIKEKFPQIAVILITAYGNIDDAVSAIKSGAFDYITKPIDLDALEISIRRAIKFRELKRENERLREALERDHKPSDIITNSSAMQEVLSIVSRAATSNAAILIQGESGTGKELIARAIHQASPRCEKPLVTINCAAISENLMESELFGHEKGAFTGAVQQRRGRVEDAADGSIFLDEVGDVPLGLQVKLLRFLQFGQFERVGGNRTHTIDTRIIAATNRNLQEMMNAGRFREDLYYRLNVISVTLPPLRKRIEDIPHLVDHFVQKSTAQYGKHINGISREALDSLMRYDFPGNIRELQNIIERAIILSRQEFITTEDLPLLQQRPEHLTGTLTEKVNAYERDLIIDALKANDFNQSAAARQLGIGERQLRYKIDKYKLKGS